MMPIQELLSRIRWDADFGKADFEIGYLDRIQQRIVRVPLKELAFVDDDPFDFQFYDQEGETHSVPLHRIKAVYRDGDLIWHREH
jgi:uncharacterized protein (UPF0248 family)